ncbi:chlorophyll a/b-binding protein [Thermoleptolyngbya sp. C42_A2020_037]|jgi:hypothetical protein|uniref:High light inducible protein n=1 Tax=Thermoleptolyngbya oregonensis NK1-22 TaxID=2547457 RepID=A0AA96Y4X4_9CYAN|nr:chlorophyll a/b-binding protein [Thermoleptolyngbya sp. C42_A2020_037]MBF2083685.1 high light inducible protein [Thermoleptolyngbya sp. C42_A2020_037]WOB44882.1 high light inducible protein [Thermoleptolyngbya oregonensis NK1-22]
MRGVVTEEQGRQNIYAVEPQMYVDSEARTGFTEYAEKLNGRLAMIGFVSMLLLEVLTHQGLVSLLQNL